MIRLRLRLPHWTAHPGFGVALLLVLAVILIAHGEPQPSSRPSGTSVGVSGTATADGAPPAILVIRGDRLQLHDQGLTRSIALPAAALPRSVVPGRGLSVVLAAVHGRQRAYAIEKNLSVRDLGYADGVFPAVSGSAAVIVESALTDPGLLLDPSPTASGSPADTGSASTSPPAAGQPDLRDYSVRRYDSTGRLLGPAADLPRGTRVGTDSPDGLVVWQPVNRVFDGGVAMESLSAAATLIRPDGSLRALGPVHPLASIASDLLVWDVAGRRFGLMPLRYVTSTATTTASPRSSSAAEPSSTPTRPAPTTSPSTVAGVRWFQPTRGMIVITGPATFNADGSAFAVYGQVGTRRRLVVAELKHLGTDQVEVLALAQPPARNSPVPSGNSPSGSGSATVGTSRSAIATPTNPVIEPDGYPIPAPLAPVWWNGLAVGLGTDGTAFGYQPGSAQSSLLDLGLTGIQALAPAP